MNFNKQSLYHLIPIIGFFIVVSIYFAPLYSGKTLMQSDNIQLKGVNKEIAEYREKGEQIHWNNKEFSGVPLQAPSSINPFYNLYKFLYLGVFPRLVMMALALFIGVYILLQVLGVSRWLAALGAFAFTFSSFNIISIEVGHDYKVLAMAFMAPVLAGVISAYKGFLLRGGILTFIAAGFQLYFGHIQITYYLLMMVLGYVALEVYNTLKSKEWNQFLRGTLVLAIATILAFGCNFTKLYSLIEYADYSTRGGSDLTEAQGEKVSSRGLDKDYALAWSSGKLETFTLAFPYFHGGASGESLSKSSKTYQALSSKGIDRRTSQQVTNNVPLYWGDQPFTGGPIYFGAIICFLFLFALFMIKGALKWWGLSLVLLSLLLAMGKNLEWFTDIFFYHVPLYNKFRSVTMIYSIAQLIFPVLGILVLERIFSGFNDSKTLEKKLIQSAGTIIGIGLIFILFKDSFFDFKGQRDETYGFPQWLLNSIIQDRKSLFVSDIFRSIIFVILSAGSVWLYIRKIIKPTHALLGIAVLIVVDLWTVDKRYLSSDDFQTKRELSRQQFQPTQADLQILQDKTYYRVLNLSAQNPFSDGLTSYFHYSILGYSAIKMQRYQELIDKYIGQVDMGILSMLNTKYIISKGQRGTPIVRKNSDALGNAWLVHTLISASGADEEYNKVGEIELSNEAIFDDSRYGEYVLNTRFSGVGDVELVSYHPEEMIYDFSSTENQFVVFSEIYYGPGWNAYIDGTPSKHVRVNYVLRGLEVPEGDHRIVFKYEPASIEVGRIIIIASMLLVIIGTTIFFYIRKRKTENASF